MLCLFGEKLTHFIKMCDKLYYPPIKLVLHVFYELFYLICINNKS